MASKGSFGRMLAEDKQIMERPECEGDCCNNKGICFINGLLLCGECVLKQQNSNVKIVVERI